MRRGRIIAEWEGFGATLARDGGSAVRELSSEAMNEKTGDWDKVCVACEYSSSCFENHVPPTLLKGGI